MNRLDLVYLPLAAITAPVWMRKARGDWAGRFGRIARLPDPPMDAAQGKPRPRILLHAVSVGEVSALRGLVPLLRQHSDVVVSVGTDTGIARARALFADEPNEGTAGGEEKERGGASCLGAVRVVRYPLDLSRAVDRFLDAVRPDVVGLVELELWPNFVRACERRNIPIAVINGRLSARSFRGYFRFRSFFRRSFSRLSLAAVQDDDYAKRFIAMGVPADRVMVTGSMKWDSVRPREPGEVIAGAADLARAFGLSEPSDIGPGADRSPLIVGGSTGPIQKSGSSAASGFHARNEEELLHAACPPGAALLCAPRRPERFDEAFGAMGGAQACIRRTRRGDDSDESESSQRSRHLNRFLLDTIGELRAAYSLATIVVMGRSFGGLHGSDPIEPIAMGVPTIIGPHHSDFAQIVAAFKRADAVEIVDAAELPAALKRLLIDRDRRAQLVANGRRCILENQGASARHAELLLRLAKVVPTVNRGVEHV